MTRSLTVILEGKPIGLVERTRAGSFRLTYLDDARSQERTPLSLSLRSERSSLTGDRVETFLRALLPESDGALAAIERRYHGTDRRDPLSLLAAIGRDCAGAVQFCTPDEVDTTIARTGSLVAVSDADIEQRLAELRIDGNASWMMEGEHWSLGGTQAKFALRLHHGMWHEAQGSQPTSHIFKPGVQALRSQSLIEHATMRAAAACGVDVAHSEYAEFKSETAIVITRFDRTAIGDELLRVHQEDLCQALGMSEKYEEYGGPSAATIIQLLRDSSRTAAAARENVSRFVDGLVFNTVLAAPDAHARNYAVILSGEDVRLAPLFDVSTGLAYQVRTDRTLSMSIGGEFRAARIGHDQWMRFADEAGLDAEAVLNRARVIAETAPRAMRAAIDEVDDWDGSIAELRRRLEPALDSHVSHVLRSLAPSRSAFDPRLTKSTFAESPEANAEE